MCVCARACAHNEYMLMNICVHMGVLVSELVVHTNV